MRLIHTSDWHLGQHFYTKSRAAEHLAFLDWLRETAEQHRVDAIIVAGDIFDTATPPSYARELYNHFIVQLQGSGCQLIILGGNHDSVATLDESRELLACLNTHVIAAASEHPAERVLLLNEHTGRPGALLCTVPFLRPRDIVRSQAGQSGRQKQQQLQTAITDYYQNSYQYALHWRKKQGLPQLPIMATGHLTTLGASKSDAVRDIYIGTLDAFPAQAFPPADYIALGHIHRAQCVGGTEHIRYSGSPIPLSFDEASHQKSVFLIEMNDHGLHQVETLPVPCFRSLKTLKGSLAEIEQQLSLFRHTQTTKPVWLDIEIDTHEYINDVQLHIQQLTEMLPVDVLLLRRSREQREKLISQQQNETLNELTAEEVFNRRMMLEEAFNADQRQRLQHCFNEVLHEIDQKGQP